MKCSMTKKLIFKAMNFTNKCNINPKINLRNLNIILYFINEKFKKIIDICKKYFRELYSQSYDTKY